MPEREKTGGKAIEEVQRPLARVAKLERIALRKDGPKDADRELDRAWSEWETTFDAIGDSVILLDSEFNIVQANAATSSLLGKPLDEIVGQRCCKLVHGSNEPLENCPLIKAKTTKKRQKAELYIAEKGIWAFISVDPILDEQSNLTGAVHIIRDITERKKAEEALQESEQRFRNIFDNAVVGLYRTTPDGRILMANPALLRMLGYSSFEDLAERNLEQYGFAPHSPRSVFKERIEAVGGVFGLESAWIKRDGTTVFIRESAKVIRDPDGNPLYYEGTVEDITERKKAEEALQESVWLLRDTGEMAKVGGWELDLSTKEVLWTEEVCRIHGVEPGYKPKLEEALNFYAPESRAGVEAAVKKTAETGEPYDLESLFIPLGGKDKIWVRSLGKAVYSAGKIVKLAGTFQNIDKYKRAEEELRSSEEKFSKAFNLSPSAVFITTLKEGRFIEINKTGLDMYGYKPDEIVGRTVKDLGIWADLNDRATLLARLQKEGIVRNMEASFRRKSGEVFPAIISVDTIDIAGQQFLLSTNTDITERKQAEEELKRLKKQTEFILGATKTGLDIIDSEFNMVYIDPEWQKVYGEYKGKKCYKYFMGSNTVCPNCGIVKSLKTKKPVVSEEVLAKEGNRPIQVTTIPFQDENGNWLVAEVNVDITERKKAEEEIESLAKFPAENPYPVLRITKDGEVLYSNEAGKLLLMHWDSRVGKTVPQKWRSSITEAFRSKKTKTEEEKVEDRIFSCVIAPVIDTGYVNLYGRDVTECKRAEEALAQSEQKYKELFESAREAIIIMDLNGKITDANRIVEEYGSTRDYLLGKSIFDFIPVNHRARAAKDFDELCHGTPVKGEMEVIAPKGNLTVEYRDNPIVRGGQVVAVQAILMDITKRKRVEQALRDYQARLKSLAAELALAEERERRRIAAGIHDGIGQKLALAKMELQLLARSPGKSKIPASLDSVCARIDEAIKDAHSLTFELSNPALYDLSFKAAIDLWLLEQIQKKHGIKCTVIAGEQAVLLDENSRVVLFRALRELAVNVVKHAKATALTVTIEKLENSVQITCKDDGLGFAPPEAGALPRDVGGFGLFNIKERLEYLGGGMKLHSAPGRGTLITLSLPLKRQNDAGADEGRQ